MSDPTAEWPEFPKLYEFGEHSEGRYADRERAALEARLRTTAEALREMVARCGQCDGTGEAEDDTDPDPITGQVYPASCEFCEAARAILAQLEKEGLA